MSKRKKELPLPPPEAFDKPVDELSQELRDGVYGDPEHHIKIARALRRGSDIAERRYMNFLHALDRSDCWRCMNNGTFSQYLKAYHLCDGARYDRYLAMVETAPSEVVNVIGLEAGLQSMRVEAPELRAALWTRMTQTATNEGVPLSKRHAETLTKFYLKPNSRYDAQKEKLLALEAECTQLRRALRAMERENNRLRKQLENFERSGGTKKKRPKNGGGDSASKGA